MDHLGGVVVERIARVDEEVAAEGVAAADEETFSPKVAENSEFIFVFSWSFGDDGRGNCELVLGRDVSVDSFVANRLPDPLRLVFNDVLRGQVDF